MAIIDAGHAVTGRGRRLAWFIGLWAAGVASVGLVSLILRAWIGHH